ncbi:Cut9-interacting protein scn1 [Staphylotrichum tortipilum]|uniref:Cut9-interacting protein scn1 n=1 Tax=Staphylotrichum tortipilum TaxID=2831512 RepID=A0AAN6MKA7_9PEZI|nr:Cut9-interacting protein scn1 [Staphylotrichum longicolle]
MCQPYDGDGDQPHPSLPVPNASHADDFPWHIGVCDAHCHPTDTMASIASIAPMRARVLTIMATRSQDQDLVASVAAQQGIPTRASLVAPPFKPTAEFPISDRVVPSFGWHPWFSHQLYDDTVPSPNPASPTPISAANHEPPTKTAHYTAVLSPAPSADFIESLPDPLPLSAFLAATRARVLAAHGVALVGEIGLDKAFRLPWPHPQPPPSNNNDDGAPLTPGGREGRLLSPHHVRVPHQLAVLAAQLHLAGEMGVAVSVHGVQAHGVLFDALAGLWKGFEKEVVSRRKQRLVAVGAEDFSSEDEEEEEEDGEEEEGRGKKTRGYKPKPFPPRICLHSFGGSAQTLQQYTHPAVPARVYFSFSAVINLSTAGAEGKFPEVVRACPDDRLLVESDLHRAGEEMDRVLEEVVRRVCEVKGWGLEEGVERLRRNYEAFVFG